MSLTSEALDSVIEVEFAAVAYGSPKIFLPCYSGERLRDCLTLPLSLIIPRFKVVEQELYVVALQKVFPYATVGGRTPLKGRSQ